MEFFLTLADVGQGMVLDLFNNIITFFNTPLGNLIGMETSYVTVESSAPEWLKIFGSGGDLIYHIWNYLDPPYVDGQVVFSGVWKLFGGALQAMGLDMSVPLWVFLVSNIGIILLLSLAIKFMSVVT